VNRPEFSEDSAAWTCVRIHVREDSGKKEFAFMTASRAKLAMLLAAVLGLLGLLAGFVMPGVTGDLLRVVLFAVALVLVIIAAAAGQRVRRSG
jgi:hypothetical protein